MNEEYPFAQKKHLIHIKGLEATLAERNRTIEKLQAQVAEAYTTSANSERLNREYRRGWKDCANSLMGATHKAAQALREIRAEAFELYLEGEKK